MPRTSFARALAGFHHGRFSCSTYWRAKHTSCDPLARPIAKTLRGSIGCDAKERYWTLSRFEDSSGKIPEGPAGGAKLSGEPAVSSCSRRCASGGPSAQLSRRIRHGDAWSSRTSTTRAVQNEYPPVGSGALVTRVAATKNAG